jgi:hypothetical protein
VLEWSVLELLERSARVWSVLVQLERRHQQRLGLGQFGCGWHL